jgi:hypothetical protein
LPQQTLRRDGTSFLQAMRKQHGLKTKQQVKLTKSYDRQEDILTTVKFLMLTIKSFIQAVDKSLRQSSLSVLSILIYTSSLAIPKSIKSQVSFFYFLFNNNRLNFIYETRSNSYRCHINSFETLLKIVFWG